MQWLFEGLPSGVGIPWGVWVAPLLWWFCLIAAFVLASICSAVVLRRQWSDNERLTYPMLTPALAIVGEDSGFSDIWRSHVFWVGFAIAFGMVSWNILTFFSPVIPPIPRSFGSVSLGRGLPSVPLRINFFLMGFAYFANLDVLASFWGFFLLFLAEVSIFNRVGFDVGPNGDGWSSYHAAYSWQGMGAMTFLVLSGLWVGRHHLRTVARTALRPGPQTEDSQEMVSYRTAFWGLILSVVFIIGWLVQAGMGVLAASLFVFLSFVIYLGIARIVTESGLIGVRGPMTAQSFCFYGLGAETLSGGGLTVLAFSYALLSHGNGLFMTALVHAARLTDIVKANRRRMLWALLGALLVGTLVSVVYTLYLGYTLGAYNFNPVGPFSSGPRRLLDKVVNKMKSPFPPSGGKIAFFWIGIAAMAAMSLLRSRFPRWPINPIGLPVSGTWLTRIALFSILIVWAVKAIILRTGGVLLYRRAAPFFVGLVVGQALGVGLSVVVDIVWFNGQGHRIYGW